jgi:hypothetical protein
MRDGSSNHFPIDLPSNFKLFDDHLPYVVKHLHNMHAFGFLHQTIETFRKVVVDVIYFAFLQDFASTPYVWMIVIQLIQYIRTLLFYL